MERYVLMVLILAPTTTTTTAAPPHSCTDYKELKDGRRSTRYTATDGTYLCDRELEEGWYRPMTGTGKDMPTYAPNITNCGTAFPIWYSGDLPALGETVTGDACMIGLLEDCEETIEIQIQNCGDYNLYYLTPTTSCSSAYCFGEDVACGAGFEVGVYPNCLSNEATPLISDPVLDWMVGPFLEFEQVVFRCNVSTEGLDPDHDLLDLTFLIGDKVKKEFTALPFDELPTKLYGYQDFDKNYNDDDKLAFNKMMRCDVRTRRNGTGTISPTRSVEQFYGFQITSPTNLVLEEGEVAQIDIHLNLPVLELLGSFVNVDLHIPMFYLGNFKGCLDGLKLKLMMAHTSCSVTFDVSHEPQSRSLQVVGLQQKNYFPARKMIIKLASTATSSNKHISDFPLEPIAVTLEDKKRSLSTMMCYAVVDPHMRLYDGVLWEMQFEGEFILYKHDTLKHEVQIKTERCFPAWCPCAVVVRSGLSGYIIDTCGPRNRHSSFTFKQAPRIKMYDCADGQQDMEIDQPNANSYIFTFSTKTRVHVHVNAWHEWHNLRVYPSLADMNSSGGVCGRITKEGKAQRVNRDGNDATSDREFANSWRVDPEERLFTEQDLTFTEPVYYCNCADSGDNITCGVSPKHNECIENYERITGKENAFCQQNKQKRKKRSAQPWKRSIDEQATVMEDNNGYIEYEEENGPIPEPVWHNGWTEDTARAYCENFMKSNPATQACKDLIPAMEAEETGAVNTCMLDIKLTGETDASSIHLESLLAVCMDELEKDTDLWEPHPVTGEYTIPTAITNSVCPSQCKGRGDCINGACECSTGFSGADCSVNDTAVPEIFRLPQDGLCDLQDWTCSAIKVYAYDTFDTPTLTCKTTMYWVKESGMEERESVETAGELDRLYTVICLLPNVEEEKPNDVIGKLYVISLSNDGVRYGNEGSMMVFDGYCVECSVQEDGHKCSLKAGACSIGSSCYSDGEVDPSASCQFCDPATDRHAWTQKNGSCVMDGACYLADEENPNNACQLCQPHLSMTSWTHKGIVGCATTTSTTSSTPAPPSHGPDPAPVPAPPSSVPNPPPGPAPTKKPNAGSWSSCSQSCGTGIRTRNNAQEEEEFTLCKGPPCEDTTRGVEMVIKKSDVITVHRSLGMMKDTLADELNNLCASRYGLCCNSLLGTGFSSKFSSVFAAKHVTMLVLNATNNGIPVMARVGVQKDELEHACTVTTPSSSNSGKREKRSERNESPGIVDLPEYIIYEALNGIMDNYTQDMGLVVVLSPLPHPRTESSDPQGFLESPFFPLLLVIIVCVITAAIVIACVCRWKNKRPKKIDPYQVQDPSYGQHQNAPLSHQMSGWKDPASKERHSQRDTHRKMSTISNNSKSQVSINLPDVE